MKIIQLLRAVSGAALLAGVAGSAAAAVTINFDIAQGTYTPSAQGVPHDISDEFASLGVKFRSAADYTTPGATLGDCSGGVGSDPVHLYGFGRFAGICGEIFPNIDILFVDPNDSSLASYTTAFSILVTDSNDTTLSAYDAGGVLLGIVSTSGPAFNQRLSLSSIGQIARVNVRTINDATALDDLIFDDVHTAGVGAIPEPATWALMIGGFGLAGVGLRRRRAATA